MSEQQNTNVAHQQNNGQPTNTNPYDVATHMVQMRQMINSNLMQENSRLFFLLLALLVGVFIALGNYAIIIKKNTPPYYIPVNSQNQYLAPTPLQEPMYSDEAIKARSIQVSEVLFRYDFTSYIGQINDNRHLFTEKGWESYNTALKNSQTLDMIRNNKMIVKFKPRSAPVILENNKGVLPDGRYAWEVEIAGEVQTQYFNATSRQMVPQNHLATVKMMWVREGIHKYEDGVAIQRYELIYKSPRR